MEELYDTQAPAQTTTALPQHAKSRSAFHTMGGARTFNPVVDRIGAHSSAEITSAQISSAQNITNISNTNSGPTDARAISNTNSGSITGVTTQHQIASLLGGRQSTRLNLCIAFQCGSTIDEANLRRCLEREKGKHSTTSKRKRSNGISTPATKKKAKRALEFAARGLVKSASGAEKPGVRSMFGHGATGHAVGHGATGHAVGHGGAVVVHKV